MIREITNVEIPFAGPIIRRAFTTVAEQFGLTPEKCPAHTAFLTDADLQRQIEQGLHLFAVLADGEMAGIVGIKPEGQRTFSMEKLAVLPEYRHCGYGAQLVAFTDDWIRQQHGEKIVIGLIDEHLVLKQWYTTRFHRHRHPKVRSPAIHHMLYGEKAVIVFYFTQRRKERKL